MMYVQRTLFLVLLAQASAWQLASPVSSRSVVRRSRSPVAMDGLVDAAQHVDTAQQIFTLVAEKVDSGKAFDEISKTAGPVFDSAVKTAGPLLQSAGVEAGKAIEAAIPELQKGFEASKPVLEKTANELGPVAKQAADIVAPVLQQALVSAGQAALAAGTEIGKQAGAAAGPAFDQLTAQASAQLAASGGDLNTAVSPQKDNIDQVVKTLGAGADAAKPLIEKGIKEATPYAESAGKEVAQVASKVARDGLRGVLSFLDDFVND